MWHLWFFLTSFRLVFQKYLFWRLHKIIFSRTNISGSSLQWVQCTIVIFTPITHVVEKAAVLVPMGMLDLKWGVVRRMADCYLEAAESDSAIDQLKARPKVKSAVCFLLSKGCIRCWQVQTVQTLHDFMIWESSFSYSWSADLKAVVINSPKGMSQEF